MKQRYLSAIVIVITLLSVLIAYPRESDAERGKCKLRVEFEAQQNENWCWVATVSMVLKSHGLPNVEQCHLYDLAKANTTSCTDMEKFPTKWQEKNNLFGSPQEAAEAYDSHEPNTIEFKPPGEEPFSFEELANQICPSDGSRGRPVIWAYDGENAAHDVVVYGYNDIGVGQLIYYHDPTSNPELVLLDPDYNAVSFDVYAKGPPPFNQNFIIEKE